MISPTARAIFLMLLGLPLMVGIALLRPDLWTLSAGWIALIGGLMVLDAMIGPALRAFETDIEAPPILYAGDSDPLPVTFRFTRGSLPARLEVQLETSELLEDVPTRGLRGWEGNERRYQFTLTPLRRGTAKLLRLWRYVPSPVSFENGFGENENCVWGLFSFSDH